MRRRVDVEADHVLQLVGKLRIVGELELADPVRRETMAAPDALHRGDADPVALAIAAAVQWVASPGGSPAVNSTTRAITVLSKGGLRDGHVLSRSRPYTPACMNRSCQRQTCFCGLFRLATIAA